MVACLITMMIGRHYGNANRKSINMSHKAEGKKNNLIMADGNIATTQQASIDRKRNSKHCKCHRNMNGNSTEARDCT